jgi:hypothetical protein
MNSLHVLMPSLACADDDPRFRKWLARGDRLPAAAEARETAIRGLFRFAGEAMPTAALRHHCHVDDASGTWLCADPACVRSEATGARLMACPVEDLSMEEASQLATAMRPLFGDAGVPLALDTPSAWCLRLADGAPPATFTPPAAALGIDLIECLPDGGAGRTWRKLFNEAQVALHVHPVNRARVASGKLPVNALWFWGRGALPGSVDSGVRVVASTDDAVRGLARLAGAACIEVSPARIDAAEGGGDALLDLDTFGGSDVAGSWFPHFRRWLRERRFDAVEFAFASGERFRVRHAHRLRFWVRQRV